MDLQLSLEKKEEIMEELKELSLLFTDHAEFKSDLQHVLRNVASDLSRDEKFQDDLINILAFAYTADSNNPLHIEAEDLAIYAMHVITDWGLVTEFDIECLQMQINGLFQMLHNHMRMTDEYLLALNSMAPSVKLQNATSDLKDVRVNKPDDKVEFKF